MLLAPCKNHIEPPAINLANITCSASPNFRNIKIYNETNTKSTLLNQVKQPFIGLLIEEKEERETTTTTSQSQTSLSRLYESSKSRANM